MGMRRGTFESTSLGDVATSAKRNSNVQIGSTASGMRAFGEGLGAVADFCGKMADMADKAYAARNANLNNALKSLESLADAKANLAMTTNSYKGKETSPEARMAISKAQSELDKAQLDSDMALDKYARTGFFYKQLGKPTAASGEKRRIDAEKRVAERIANGEDPEEVGGILDNIERQSFFGTVFGN